MLTKPTAIKEAEETTEKWYRTSPYLEALIGLCIVIVASVAELISVWTAEPGSVASVSDFLKLLIASFAYVLTFDLKLWWVLLLIIYIINRKTSTK